MTKVAKKVTGDDQAARNNKVNTKRKKTKVEVKRSDFRREIITSSLTSYLNVVGGLVERVLLF